MRNECVDVLHLSRELCKSLVSTTDRSNLTAPLNNNMLRNVAKKYKKKSRGTDHWEASEIAALLDIALGPITQTVQMAIDWLAWAIQMICNLHPELMKAKGEQRTVLAPLSCIGCGPRHDPV